MYIFNNNLPRNYKELYNKLLIEFKDYLSSLGVNTNRNVKSYQYSLKCFLYNISVSSKTLSITLSEEHYSRGAIVNGKESKLKISYTFTKRLIDFLELNGYVVLDKGGFLSYTYTFNPEYTENNNKSKFNKEANLKTSKLTLTDKWQQFKNSFVTEDYTVPVNNVLFFKDKNKRVVKRNLNIYLKSKRDYLQDLNKFNSENNIMVDGIKYSLQSYKVYNNSSDTINGKTYTYCGYQNLSSLQRENTVINGENTACLDYSCFEGSVMYTLAGEAIPDGDLYYIGLDGFDPLVERQILKTVFIIMLNSKSQLSAYSAVNKWLREQFDTNKAFKAGDIPSPVLSAKTLVKAVKEKHSKIDKYFYNVKSSENNIPNITSEINDYVVGSLLDKKVVVAQIHDGFVVTEGNLGLLEDTMLKGYEQVLGDNSNCKITREF